MFSLKRHFHLKEFPQKVTLPVFRKQLNLIDKLPAILMPLLFSSIALPIRSLSFYPPSPSTYSFCSPLSCKVYFLASHSLLFTSKTLHQGLCNGFIISTKCFLSISFSHMIGCLKASSYKNYKKFYQDQRMKSLKC